jgi:hypothetical protein
VENRSDPLGNERPDPPYYRIVTAVGWLVRDGPEIVEKSPVPYTF